MNNHADSNLGSQLQDRAYVLDTPSLVTPGNEEVAEEVLRDLFDQQWITTAQRPKPVFVIPTDTPRSQASRRTQATVVAITSDGETESLHGHRLELVDVMISLSVRITVSARGGRQELHNVKAGCRDILYRSAKVLSPYHRLYYDGFQPSYDSVNIHTGVMAVRFQMQRVPILGRRTAGQETPSSDPALFPEGLQV